MRFRRFPLMLLALVASGCASTRATPPVSTEAAMARVLAEDERLAGVRNHACETASLHDAIRAYAEGLAALDFAGCPAPFVDAFARHRQAWEASLPFFAAYGELRGEMHDLFEHIRAQDVGARVQLEAHETAIWGTWAEVEDASGHD